jgi:hypothetical protein
MLDSLLLFGIAARMIDGTLNHSGFILIDVLPEKGAKLFDREVSEVLTEEELLNERSGCALNKTEAIAVLGKKA